MSQDDKKSLSDEDVKKLMDMFPEEELDPELKPYLTTISSIGWPALQHPLVYQVPYNEIENHRLNLFFKHKKEKLNEALETNNFTSFIFLHERPYRLNAFDQVECDMEDKEYWETLSSIWTDTENFWQNQELWRYFWDNSRPGREAVMEEEEKQFLESLPEEFKVYRGFTHDEAVNGLSWTIDRKKAMWFAKRFSTKERDDANPPKLASVTVKKSQVLAYLDSRGEKEIVVDPETFTYQVKIEKLK